MAGLFVCFSVCLFVYLFACLVVLFTLLILLFDSVLCLFVLFVSIYFDYLLFRPSWWVDWQRLRFVGCLPSCFKDWLVGSCVCLCFSVDFVALLVFALCQQHGT